MRMRPIVVAALVLSATGLGLPSAVLAAGADLEFIGVGVGSAATQVAVRLSEGASYTVNTLEASGSQPHRLYIDFSNTKLAPGTTDDRPVAAGAVERVRAGQFTRSTARVVLDLREQTDYRIETHQNPFRLVIRIDNPPTAIADTAVEPPVGIDHAGIEDTDTQDAAPVPAPAPASPVRVLAKAAPPAVEAAPEPAIAAAPPEPLRPTPPEKTLAVVDEPVVVARAAEAVEPINDANAVAAPAPTEQPAELATPVEVAREVAKMEFDVEVEFAAEATRQVTGGPDALGDDAIDTEMAFVAPPAAAKDSRLAKVPTLPSFPDPLRVVIDPGHGGRDPGAQSVDGTWEKDIVLEVAHELALRTRKRLDVDVVLTRHGDETVSLDDRAAFTTGLDSIFISVHGNACPQSWVEGVQTFYPEGGTFGLQSRRLAHLVHHRVVKAIDRGYGPVHDGGVRPRELAVLKRSEAPSLLVEAAYLSNPVDRQRLDDTDYRSAFVDGVIDGIADYLSGVPAPDQLMVERDPPLHAHRDVHRVPDPRYDPYDDPYRIKVAPASFSAR